MKAGTILATACAMTVCAAPVMAAPMAHWDESKLSQPQYKVKIENLRPVKMRDGVELSADVYRPDAPGTFPLLSG